MRISLAYWKVVAFVDADGNPSATAYMIGQEQELGGLEATFGRYKTYQRSIRAIEALTDLDFGELSSYDGFSNEERATGTRVEAVLRSLADVRVQRRPVRWAAPGTGGLSARAVRTMRAARTYRSAPPSPW